MGQLLETGIGKLTIPILREPQSEGRCSPILRETQSEGSPSPVLRAPQSEWEAIIPTFKVLLV